MKSSSGQSLLMTIMLLGVILASVIMWGAKRRADVAKVAERLDTSQTAYEVLSAASKKVQAIYANESSCDPDVLNTRLSRFSSLPSAVTTLGYDASFSYAIAQPAASGTQRYNFCSAGYCRQFAIPLENRIFVVTVGKVASDAKVGTADCPRDATVRLTVAIGGNVYRQRSTLINVCTLTSCAGASFSTATATAGADAGWAATTACTDAVVPSRYYGAITTPGVLATAIDVDDLRWGRRYLETGGAAIGETTYMVTTAFTSGNGSCTAAGSASQCKLRNCIPAFDLNRDGANNESDLAIFEYFLRGYLATLPVTYLQ